MASRLLHCPPMIFAVVAAIITLASTSSEAAEPKVFRDCTGCPELVTIPAGSFIMGTSKSTKNARMRRALPAHKVVIAKPFAMGRYEVTFDEWEICLKEKGCTKDPDDHQWGKGRRPVINISFPEVGKYLAWLSKKTGKTYRLPSEAEWEYAARGGTRTRFSWGDEAGKNNANCRTCAPKISKQTYEVGKYKPNPFGLYDVHGNVWEWVQDCWNTSYKGAPADGSAWVKGTCHFRVTRGGSWYYIDANLQSAWRSKYPNTANGFSYGIGFRVVRELP